MFVLRLVAALSLLKCVSAAATTACSNYTKDIDCAGQSPTCTWYYASVSHPTARCVTNCPAGLSPKGGLADCAPSGSCDACYEHSHTLYKESSSAASTTTGPHPNGCNYCLSSAQKKKLDTYLHNKKCKGLGKLCDVASGGSSVCAGTSTECVTETRSCSTVACQRMRTKKSWQVEVCREDSAGECIDPSISAEAMATWLISVIVLSVLILCVCPLICFIVWCCCVAGANNFAMNRYDAECRMLGTVNGRDSFEDRSTLVWDEGGKLQVRP